MDQTPPQSSYDCICFQKTCFPFEADAMPVFAAKSSKPPHAFSKTANADLSGAPPSSSRQASAYFFRGGSSSTDVSRSSVSCSQELTCDGSAWQNSRGRKAGTAPHSRSPGRWQLHQQQQLHASFPAEPCKTAQHSSTSHGLQL